MRWTSVAIALLACRGSLPARGPEIDVTVGAPGFSAELVESAITTPVEEVTSRRPHVTRIRSRSAEGVSAVRIDFEPGTDADAAAIESGTRSATLILHDNRQRMLGFRVRADEVPDLEPVQGVHIRVVRD